MTKNRCSILFALLASTAYGADFTTYIGPSIVNQSAGVAAIATDSSGNTYVTGSNVIGTYETGVNPFVTKLDSSGNIVFSKSIGPMGSYADAIAVDPAGNVWVGGETGDTDFPLVNPLQSVPAANGIGFLVKLAPDGTVVYSSYFGGTLGNSGISGIATDASGNVYVTGFTDASDFPTTPGLPASPVSGNGRDPSYGVFAAKISSTGQKVLYSSVIAGAQDGTACMGVPKTVGLGIAIDGAGNALVAGTTNCTDLPAATDGTSGPGAFVFKINAAGDAVVYFTYLGAAENATISQAGSVTLGARPIAADAAGDAFIAGYTYGIAGAKPQTFAVELSPGGVAVWTATLGSSAGSWANAIALDSSGNVWLTGTNGTIPAPGEPFVEQLTSPQAVLPYSAQFPVGEAGQDIAIDPSGMVHFAGSIGLISTLAPTQALSPRALSIVSAASGQLTGTIAPGEIISIYGLGMGPTTPTAATPENGLFPTSLGGVQVFVNGNPIPLLYVSASQINAEIPSSIASGGLTNGIAIVQVVYALTEWDPVQQITFTQALPDFRLAIVGFEFAVFENPGGSMAVINQDGTLNKIANPAPPGSVVSIWATGFGATAPPADGAVATAANNYCSACQITLKNGHNSITETVEYAGTSPGLIDGLMQINFLIPTDFPFNGAFVYLTAPGSTQSIQLGWVKISQ
jgi:uncharacterized protein (TIGR03437 family)